MAVQWIVGFIGSYIIASLLLYPFDQQWSLAAQFVVGIALALLGAGVRVHLWQSRQERKH